LPPFNFTFEILNFNFPARSLVKLSQPLMPAHHEDDIIFPPFVPRRYLRNRHAMTLAGNFLPRVNGLPEPEERLFQVDEDAQVLCHCHWQPEPAKHGTAIIVHGLEGSSLSQYVIGTGSKAWAAGMNVVRMNMRNCGGTETLSPTLYHSGLSSDIGSVLRTLIEQKHLTRVSAVGYSMGGNLVLKMAGDWGANAPAELNAVVGVSPAADLAASADAMHQIDNRMYEWKFLLGLMRRYKRKRLLFPDRYKGLDRFPRTIREFDDLVTAPAFDFNGAEDYYTRASAARVVDCITVPTLVINAKDDPFIRLLPATRDKMNANPCITLLETDHGGHCAFLAEPNGYDGRWAELQVMTFFRAHGLI
jgi:predicted alpha/beta-fold hydrolase